MKSKPRLPILLATAIAAFAALPSAASEDGTFWKELQRTDGYQESSATPAPRGEATSVTVRDSGTALYFSIERQKTDGYVADRETDAPVMKAEATQRK